MNRHWRHTAAVLAFWIVHASVLAEPMQGEVTKVLDGDTLEILTPERTQIRIRLAWIDAPEKNQPFGARAREHLADMCAGVEAQVYPTSTDRYGRTLAEVHCLGIEANQAMISSGLAWVYRQYAPAHRPQHQALYELEAQARARSWGLWSDPHPTAPWAWRQAQKQAQ